MKPNTVAEFTKKLEQSVIPLLRKQRSFKDEIVFSTAGSPDVLAISLWDNKQNAEAYGANSYKDVLKMLEKMIEGTPKVGSTEVLSSTLHETRPAVPAAAAVAPPVSEVA